MKRVCLLLLVLIMPLCFCGCQKSVMDLVKCSMSEVTEVFFLGKSENDVASISVGRRENPYIKDGVHQSECEFSLVSLSISEGFVNMRQSAVITINGKENLITLELVGKSYMYDLEYCLDKDDEVELSYGDKTIKLVRQDFEVDYENAIEIGVNHLEKEFSAYLNKNSLNGECYLKVLNEVGGDFNQLFWCFTLLGRDGKVYNVIISVHNGGIISEN